jgi:hypothetical protein
MLKAASQCGFGENAMKRILPLVVPSVLPLVAVVLVVALALLSGSASAAPETQARIVSVDYVLALMDAGIEQREIIQRIVEKNLAFRLAPGDLDRLREAGCGKELIEVVTGEQDMSQWEHPNRLGTGEGDYAAPSDGSYAPGGYSSFSFSYGYPYYYGYPAYYDPYYAYSYYYSPYGYHTRFSSPYCYYPRQSFRNAHRGSGSFRGAPRGGSLRSAPRGGGSPRSSPRGSHHH